MRVPAAGTTFHVAERGDPAGLPLLVLHGGPGLDHTEFGHHLDALRARVLLVDMRAQGRSDRDAPRDTWTLDRFAADVDALAEALQVTGRYAVLGHSYGAFVALRHAVEPRHAPTATILSSGLPSERWMAGLEETLAAFEPPELREQVQASWAREPQVRTHQDVQEVLRDQLPFHYADPRDPRIADAVADMDGAFFAPEVLAAAAREELGALELEDRLGDVAHPVLVMTGRHDRLCTADAAAFMAERIPDAELVVLEHSAHMGFAEEPEAYRAAVDDFLLRRGRPAGTAGPPSPAGAPG